MAISINSVNSNVLFKVEDSPIQYPSEGLRQFNEMAIPRNIVGETDHELIKKETAVSEKLTLNLSRVTDLEIKRLLEDMNTLDFKTETSLLLSSNLPYVALEALRRGLLDPQHGQKQAATLLNCWAALQYHGSWTSIESMSIFDSRAEELIKSTLSLSDPFEGEPFLAGDKFNLFMEKMRALPLSEQHFLLVPDVQGSGEEFSKDTISQSIKAAGINVFNRVNVDGVDLRMVPSVGMMQAFLEAQYGDDAVEIKPRIYLSTLRHIYDTRLTDTCDMMIPSPDQEGKNRCPSTADGFEAPWYDFPYHDFYHSILTSAVGSTYRKVGILASDLIQDYAKTAPAQDQEGLGQLAESMIDMEYPEFHHYIENTLECGKEHVFWIEISVQIAMQKYKFLRVEEGKREGIVYPSKIYPISEESELGVFHSLYHSFVHEKRGPSELNATSFKAAVKCYEADFKQNHPSASIKHPILELDATVS